MILSKDIENCSKWMDSEDIPHFWEMDQLGNTKFFIKVGDYDYEISTEEILYRSELVESEPLVY